MTIAFDLRCNLKMWCNSWCLSDNGYANDYDNGNENGNDGNIGNANGRSIDTDYSNVDRNYNSNSIRLNSCC